MGHGSVHGCRKNSSPLRSSRTSIGTLPTDGPARKELRILLADLACSVGHSTLCIVSRLLLLPTGCLSRWSPCALSLLSSCWPGRFLGNLLARGWLSSSTTLAFPTKRAAARSRTSCPPRLIDEPLVEAAVASSASSSEASAAVPPSADDTVRMASVMTRAMALRLVYGRGPR